MDQNRPVVRKWLHLQAFEEETQNSKITSSSPAPMRLKTAPASGKAAATITEIPIKMLETASITAAASQPP